MIDYGRTIISQYGASTTIQDIIESLNDCLDPRVNVAEFQEKVWDINTAVGFGLDFWGKVVGVSRLLRIPLNLNTFGFSNTSIPDDWRPFGQGTFYTGNATSQTYLLPDDSYRVLILTKALANIVRTTSPATNALLRNLFPGRGRCYVIDSGSMTMRFVFEFDLSLVEYAILTQSGVLPHPTGVRYSVTVIPTGGTFGFAEQGALPFNDGTFNMPPPI